MTTVTAEYYRRLVHSSHSSPASGAINALVRNALSDTKSTVIEAASSLPARAFADLIRLSRECSKEGWDGYSAKPIAHATFMRAQAFLNDLPPWMPAPDIVPEMDGEIAIEWYLAENYTFSVSIGGDGPLHYAGLFGHDDEVHGVKPFDGMGVPSEILQLICRLLRSPAAAHRAA